MRLSKFLFLVLFMLSLNASVVSWLGDYDKALEEAKKEQKPLLVLLVKKECKTCNDIIVKCFMNRDYVDRLNEKYVAVMVTYEGESSYPIELLYSTTFPTLFFLKNLCMGILSVRGTCSNFIETSLEREKGGGGNRVEKSLESIVLQCTLEVYNSSVNLVLTQQRQHHLLCKVVFLCSTLW